MGGTDMRARRVSLLGDAQGAGATIAMLGILVLALPFLPIAFVFIGGWRLLRWVVGR